MSASTSRAVDSRLCSRLPNKLINGTLPNTPLKSTSLSPSPKRISATSRLPVQLSSLLSMMPLHTAIASSRMTSAQSVESQSGGLIPLVFCVYNVPLLSASEAIERSRRSRESYKSTQKYLAMYSSVFGGITTDEAAMVIPMDDHMVHRGHGVFDTAAIVDGCLYELEQHLDRFLGSAKMAKIDPPFDKETMRRILIQTVSASGCKNGSLRYWLSSGTGDFQLSPSGCHGSTLYAIVIQDTSPPNYKGVKVTTSSIPIKPPQFAIMKSVNYLPNVLSKVEAEEKGAYAAICLDEEGFVAEGPNMNVAIVTQENELLMPRFDKILSGCTAKRVLELVGGLVKEGKVRDVKVRDVSVEEGKRAHEMMLIGSGVLVRPVLQWDDQVIGNGKEGVVTESLRNLILDDMKNGPSMVRTAVSY